MHERTFVLGILSLDLMLVLAGGVMAWTHALPPAGHPWSGGSLIAALVSTAAIGMVGGFLMYQLNAFAFALAESSHAERGARWVTGAFVLVSVAGGLLAVLG